MKVSCLGLEIWVGSGSKGTGFDRGLHFTPQSSRRLSIDEVESQTRVYREKTVANADVTYGCRSVTRILEQEDAAAKTARASLSAGEIWVALIKAPAPTPSSSSTPKPGTAGLRLRSHTPVPSLFEARLAASLPSDRSAWRCCVSSSGRHPATLHSFGAGEEGIES